MEDNRPTLDEVCMEYKECIEECPGYEFCHSMAESEESVQNVDEISDQILTI